MNYFDLFLALLGEIEDPRRKEGKLYVLSYVILFSILAIMAGANSYRGIHTFIEAHLETLNAAFGLSWKKAPVHSAIRYILKGLASKSIEQAFRKHAAAMEAARATLQNPDAQQQGTKQSFIAIDGKTLKHSFDNLKDRKAAQILSAFSTQEDLILAHVEIDDKSNEIPAAQHLMAELNLTGRILTLDAMHCQKKLFKPPRMQAPT